MLCIALLLRESTLSGLLLQDRWPQVCRQFNSENKRNKTWLQNEH